MIELITIREDVVIYQKKGVFSRIRTLDTTVLYNWLKADGKLDWIEDSADEKGEHKQKTGTVTFEEYVYFSTFEKIEQDLERFFIARSLTAQG